MMKKTKLIVSTLVMVASMGFTAYAGQWQQDTIGWWYQNDDGSYPVNQWQEIDEKQYYFDTNGYMLSNTTTPDGYQVGADGAWIEGASPTQVQTVVNVEGLAAQQNGYVVTYQYFNVFEDYGNTEYQAIIEIQNTSAGNLYLADATFDIYNTSGQIVASETLISSDPDVIAPGEKGYFYSNGGYLDDVPMGEYVMRPTLKVEPSSLPATRYPVSNTTIKTLSFGDNITVVGNITNNTSEEESILWIVLVLYNSNNVPIGVCGTNILNLQPGSTMGFEIEGWHLPEYVTLNDVTRYEVIAAPYQFQF